MQTKRIFGVEVVNERETGSCGIFDADQANYIQLWSPKRNYSVPRFHLYQTSYFSAILTLDTCKVAFEHYRFMPVGKYLVNTRLIKDISKKGMTKFDGSTVKEILLPRDKAKLISAYNSELNPLPDDLELIGVKFRDFYTDNEEIEYGWFRFDEICYIDIHEVKANYRVPRFHTTKGIFTVILTINECAQIFPSFRKMGGMLLNMESIADRSETEHNEQLVLFKDGSSIIIPDAQKDAVELHLLKRNDLAF